MSKRKRTVYVVMEIQTDRPLPDLRKKETWQTGRLRDQMDIRQIMAAVAQPPKETGR